MNEVEGAPFFGYEDPREFVEALGRDPEARDGVSYVFMPTLCLEIYDLTGIKCDHEVYFIISVVGQLPPARLVPPTIDQSSLPECLQVKSEPLLETGFEGDSNVCFRLHHAEVWRASR